MKKFLPGFVVLVFIGVIIFFELVARYFDNSLSGK